MMIPAAQYLRVSTAAQETSLAQQEREIAAYAARNGYEVVQTYRDQGRSGMRLKGRVAMQQLLADVVGGATPFKAILVQDVSRWGRFQDADEAAHYEYICRSAGVNLIYCAEGLSGEDVKAAQIYKAMKRLMAADFSRALSQKTRARQFALAEQGFKMGGRTGYGLRRAYLDAAGDLIVVPPTAAAPAGRRLILVPGPPEEVETVHLIFHLYLQERISMREIARRLNTEGIPGERGAQWHERAIAYLLNNPKYAGENVFGRKARTPDGHRATRPKTQLVHVPGAYEPVVPKAWIRAAGKRRQHQVVLLPDEAWRRAKRLAERLGRLTPEAVDAARNLPKRNTIYRHFGAWNRIWARLNDFPAPHLSVSRWNLNLADYDPRRFEAASRNLVPRPEAASSAFLGDVLFRRGPLVEVVDALARAETALNRLLLFDDNSGLSYDAGTAAELKRLQSQLKYRRRAAARAAEAKPSSDTLVCAYRVAYALGGHLPGYTAACRALFDGDSKALEKALSGWPSDLADYVLDRASCVESRGDRRSPH